MDRSATVLTACMALATSGCFAQQQQAQSAAAAREKLAVCAAPKQIQRGDIIEERPLTTSELIMLGNGFRDTGLSKQAAGAFGGGDDDLTAAAGCYGKALQWSAESYGANLGLGVSYVGRARNINNENDPTRTTYLNAAKRVLGYAYMLRHGAYEPLYFLAEVAALEEDWARASAYLEQLKKGGYKLGPVYALQGYIAEEQGNKSQAAVLYELAMNAGWPHETVSFVSRKVEEIR